MKKIKIAFVLDTMIYGGIERVAINYLNCLNPEEYDIDVFILDKKTEPIIEEIPSYCNIIKWNVPRLLCPEAYWKLGIKYNGGVLLYILSFLITSIMTPVLKIKAKKYKKYDISIAFSGHYNDLYMTGKIINSKNKIAWLHGALYSYLASSPSYYKLYNKFDKLVVLSELGQDEMLLLYPNLKDKLIKIWNPIPEYDNKSLDEEKIENLKNKYGDFVLMVGRMSSPKDHKTVVDAIKLINSNRKDKINLVCLGDGEKRQELEAYIEKVGMNEYTFIEGSVHDVGNYYSSAKLLVHSSYYEGLPTVLLEAMSCGLPVVATDSPPGVREILGNNEFGLICNIKDSKNMSNQILKMYEDKELYEYYINKGKNRILDFSPENIKSQFEKMIFQLLKEEIKYGK